MEDPDQNERLEAIVARFFAPAPRGLLGIALPPFDTSQPNIHDSKAEFLAEQAALDQALGEATALRDFLAARWQPDEDAHVSSKSVLVTVDEAAKSNSVPRKLETVTDLICKNAADIGLSWALVYLMIDLVFELQARKQELERQKENFWTGTGRPPNYYPRIIALRFAKLIAQNTGKKPTFGTSRDGGHPSTEFGRALEDVFEILGIEVSVRHPALWAIKQLTEEDLQPEPKNALASFGLGSLLGAPPQENALANLTNVFAKGG